jgi:hypothetical protein
MGGVRKDIPAEMQTGSTSTQVRLRGRVLLLARGAWLAFAIFLLILCSVNLLQPLFGGQTVICPLTFTCPFDTPTLQALQQTHIALPIYTIYTTAFGLFFSLVFVGLSVLLFWRVFDQLVGLLASFSFLMLGTTSLVPNFSNMPVALQVFGGVIQPLLMFLCFGFFLVTFPDGHFVPRWSWLIGFTLFVQAIFFILPGPLNVLAWPLPLILLELAVAYGSPVAIQVYRYRRIYTPAQRQQTKWVIFGWICAIVLFLLAVSPVLDVLGPLFTLASESLSSFAFLLIPLSITMAILRSRLWEIDVLINRTLVYGLLTASLLAVYLVLVLAGQALLSSMLGHNDGPVIVGSTLIVAALFQPLRRRIQRVIDRRFYRRKYDAQKTLAAFSATLRGEVDLEQLREHLLAVVEHTMQPAHVSLWLRTPQSSAQQQRVSTNSPHKP